MERRLPDEDVVALVTNDVSRLHRKSWEIGRLIEWLEEYDVELVTASPTSPNFDPRTIEGKIHLSIVSMMHEMDVNDASRRAKDSVLYRKSQGISVGRPPFGTVRNEKGQLIPSPDGAWLNLENGKYITGNEGDEPPGPDCE